MFHIHIRRCHPIESFNYFSDMLLTLPSPRQVLHFWIQTSAFGGKLTGSDTFIALNLEANVDMEIEREWVKSGVSGLGTGSSSGSDTIAGGFTVHRYRAGRKLSYAVDVNVSDDDDNNDDGVKVIFHYLYSGPHSFQFALSDFLRQNEHLLTTISQVKSPMTRLD